MFRGAPNPELATRFIEFVLSMEGQRLWAFKTGASDGLGWGSCVAAVLMLIYGVMFLSKSKSIIT
jgi:hypothetical protein